MQYLLSRRSRQRERLKCNGRVRLFVCLSVCLSVAKIAKTRFSQKLSNLELWCLLTTYRLFKEPIIGSLKSKMAKIHHLENRHYVIFSAEGGPIWIKFRRLVQNDMSTAVVRSKSKPGVQFQYGGRLGESNGMSSQSHLLHCRVLPPGEFNVMIPELRVTLQRAATMRIQCHDFRATYHIAGCCQLVNSVSRFQSHMPHCRV